MEIHKWFYSIIRIAENLFIVYILYIYMLQLEISLYNLTKKIIAFIASILPFGDLHKTVFLKMYVNNSLLHKNVSS